jgi:hypothetical protein
MDIILFFFQTIIISDIKTEDYVLNVTFMFEKIALKNTKKYVIHTSNNA